MGGCRCLELLAQYRFLVTTKSSLSSTPARVPIFPTLIYLLLSPISIHTRTTFNVLAKLLIE